MIYGILFIYLWNSINAFFMLELRALRLGIHHVINKAHLAWSSQERCVRALL